MYMQVLGGRTLMSMLSVGGSLSTRQQAGSSRAGAQLSPPFLTWMGRDGPFHWAGKDWLHLGSTKNMVVSSCPAGHDSVLCCKLSLPACKQHISKTDVWQLCIS